ncbi:MAG: twin-arginine translocation pathway signal protein, partial [Pseudomonadota bacterium]
GAFLSTRTPHAALAPWAAAGAEPEPRRFALSYAILAPNPHNRQPWLVDLSTPDTVILHRDLERDLPQTDPYARQLTIGLGCFLELMDLAAGAAGKRVQTALYPDGEDGPVAVARFGAGGVEDPLFAHALARRSCKEPFSERAVGDAAAAALAPYADIHRDPERVAALKDLIWRAFQIEMTTPRTLKESVDLMRFGKSEINARPDGIDLGGPFLESMMLLGVVSREAQLDPSSAGFQEGLRIYRETFAATPAFAAIRTQGAARADQIAAGRLWLRLNLAATAAGLALHPVSQALQEFPEMRAAREEAHALLAEPGETVQMLGRLGYGPSTPQTPRWPLETRIVARG